MRTCVVLVLAVVESTGLAAPAAPASGPPGLAPPIGAQPVAAPPPAAPGSPGAPPDPPTGSKAGSGVELGVAFDAGTMGPARFFELQGKLGVVIESRVSLFGTLSVGGASEGVEGAIFGAIGGGGRLWLDRAFIQARFERMAIAGLDCDESCGVTVNRVSAGIGFDVLRGRYGGLELSLEINRVADDVGVTFGIGGSVHSP